MLIAVPAAALASLSTPRARKALLREARLALLRGLPALRAAPDETLVALADALALQEAAPGTALVREGEVATQLLFLLSGAVDLSRAGEWCATLEAGALCGALPVRRATQVATARCFERCLLLVGGEHASQLMRPLIPLLVVPTAPRATLLDADDDDGDGERRRVDWAAIAAERAGGGGVAKQEEERRGALVWRLPSVLARMADNLADEEIQCEGAAAIATIATELRRVHAEVVARSGAPAALVEALAAHPTQLDVQRACCAAIALVAVGAPAATFDAGAADAVVFSMARCADDDETVKWGCARSPRSRRRRRRAAAAASPPRFQRRSCRR